MARRVEGAVSLALRMRKAPCKVGFSVEMALVISVPLIRRCETCRCVRH